MLEVLEDAVCGFGIDPDGDTVDIMLEIMRRMEILEAELVLPKTPSALLRPSRTEIARNLPSCLMRNADISVFEKRIANCT